jgi:hypothetical protein
MDYMWHLYVSGLGLGLFAEVKCLNRPKSKKRKSRFEAGDPAVITLRQSQEKLANRTPPLRPDRHSKNLPVATSSNNTFPSSRTRTAS